MILSTDFYWVSVPIPIANPKSTVHRFAHFTALVDFQLPRQANIERFSTHTHAHTHTRQCWQIKFHIRLLLLFSQPDFPLTWDFCAAIIKCFLISVYACAPLVCLLMSTASSPVSQPVSQSTSQSANHPVTQYPESLPPPLSAYFHSVIHPFKRATRQSSIQRAVINTCCAFKWQQWKT